MTNELLQHTKVIILYSAINGPSSDDPDFKIKVNLLGNILKPYLKVCSFSFGTDIYVYNKNKRLQKSKQKHVEMTQKSVGKVKMYK